MTDKNFNTDFADYVGQNIKDMASKAGDPLYSEFTPDALKLYMEEMRLHFSSPDAWLEIGEQMLTDRLYSEFLKKERLSEADFEEIIGGPAHIDEAKRNLVFQLKIRKPKEYYDRCFTLFKESIEISRMQARRDTVIAFIDNGGEQVNLYAHTAKTWAEKERLKYGSEGMSPNELYYLRQIYTFKDSQYRQFYITSTSGQAQGTGKTNIVAVAVELAIKEFGTSDNFNLYVPSNFNSLGYKRMYKYNQMFEIFINEPKGRSVANTVLEKQDREKKTGLPSNFFSLLVAGEQGGGYTMSYDVQDLMKTLQIERHLGIQPVYSGVLEFPTQVMAKFIPYRIAMEVQWTHERDPNKLAENKANFIAHVQHQVQHPSKLIYRDEYVIQNVPKANSKLYSGTKGFGLDTTYVVGFSIPQLFKESNYTDEAFDKDPDKFIEEWSEICINMAEKAGMDISAWTKQSPEIEAPSTRKKIDINIPSNATMDDIEKSGLI